MTNELRLLWGTVLPLAIACGGSGEASTTNGAEEESASDQTGEPTVSDLGAPDADAGPSASEPVAEGSGGAGQGETPAGGGGSGGAGNPVTQTPTGQALPIVLVGSPEHYRHIRLTHEQWENSVRDNLRLAGPTGSLDGLSPDARFRRYSNNEHQLEVNPSLIVDYAQAAQTVAQRVATDPALLAAVYPERDALGFISEVGRRFYRRPLSGEESAKLEDMFATGAGLGTASDEFTGGARLVLEVLLQSPRFLYRIEAGASEERLSGYELATKLAYFITNSTPSDALLDQARAGTLDTDDGLRATAKGLLGTTRAKATLRRFHGETFGFDAYRNIFKDPSLGYVEGTNAALEEASYLFFDRIFEGSLGVRDVFLSDVGFVSDEMAALYDTEGPGGAGFLEVRLGAERPGFFTQLPFLIRQSNNLTPHSIGRGGAINDDVLCADVPADMSQLSPPTPAGATNRETVTISTASPGCVSCHHVFLNPLGFAFEMFDGLGRLREEDNGIPIDSTGSYPFVEGQLSFDGAPELMQLLAESQQVHTCYASHLAEFGLAHELGPVEAPVVDALAESSHTNAASLEVLLLELVTNPAFHTRRGTP